MSASMQVDSSRRARQLLDGGMSVTSVAQAMRIDYPDEGWAPDRVRALQPSAVEQFPRVRQSILSTFDACALSARFDIDYRSHWTSHPAARGTLTHRVIARSLVHMVEHGEVRPNVDVTMQLFDEEMRQADMPMATDDALGETVIGIPLREIASSRVTCRTWAKYYRLDVKAGDAVLVEMRLDTVLWYPDENGERIERIFTSKPDLVLLMEGGTLGIVNDWKDTWGIPSERRSQEEALADGDNISDEGYLQMRAGALLAFRRWPRLQRIIFREIYPRYLSGKVTDRRGRLINPVRQATIDRYVLPELEAEFSALLERFDRSVESNVWTPQSGTHCSYCPRPEACTIFPSARREGRITSAEEAERVAGRLTVLDAMKDQAVKALRPWTSNHGPVPIRGAKTPKLYGPTVRTRTPRPDAATLAEHVRRGGDPQELYQSEEYVKFSVHKPEDLHPHAAAAAAEEEQLLAMQRAADAKRASR